MNLLTNKQEQQFGDEYIKILISIIKNANKDSSGNLIKSLDYKIKDTADKISILISSLDYLDYIDSGRRAGTYPNINALANWVRIKNIPQTAVFPIAHSIYQFGIKPVDIYDKSEQILFNIPLNNLEENMAYNIEEEIITRLNEANK